MRQVGSSRSEKDRSRNRANEVPAEAEALRDAPVVGARPFLCAGVLRSQSASAYRQAIYKYIPSMRGLRGQSRASSKRGRPPFSAGEKAALVARLAATCATCAWSDTLAAKTDDDVGQQGIEMPTCSYFSQEKTVRHRPHLRQSCSPGIVCFSSTNQGQGERKWVTLNTILQFKDALLGMPERQ
jgi:hypothetical protein